MGRWLSEHGRWGSPVFIAGESYGGYRVGRLARMLQESAGIGLNGAILISPALEITGARADRLRRPRLGRPRADDGRRRVPSRPLARVPARERRSSKVFARGRGVRDGRLRDLPHPRRVDARRRSATRILSRLADVIGLPLDVVTRAEGRVGILRFVRELLRDERKVLGLYDTTITATDPFPDRDEFAWPDPTLVGHQPGVHDGGEPDAAVGDRRRDGPRVHAAVYEVNLAWKDDTEQHAFAPPPGATDDFRYGMALNPHMKAFITHGRYDLVTPYYASDRLRNLMRLDPQMADRLTVQHYGGGHMFYAWEASRHAFTAAIAAFVADAT